MPDIEFRVEKTQPPWRETHVIGRATIDGELRIATYVLPWDTTLSHIEDAKHVMRRNLERELKLRKESCPRRSRQ